MAKIRRTAKTSKRTVKKDSGTKTKKGSFNIDVDDRNRIVCEYTMFNGREYLNIRYQFINSNDEWQHSKKGISIPFWGNVAEEFIKKFKKEF